MMILSHPHGNTSEGHTVHGTKNLNRHRHMGQFSWKRKFEAWKADAGN